MNTTNKPRVIKDYEKLDVEIQEQIKLFFPNGFHEHLISYTNRDGMLVSALPFETEEKYYLVRMTRLEAIAIISEDDDYDDFGNLKEEIKDEYNEKYGEEFSSEEDEDEGKNPYKDPKGKYDDEDDDDDIEIDDDKEIDEED